MVNYIEKYTGIKNTTTAVSAAAPKSPAAAAQPSVTEPLGQNVLEKYLQNTGVSASVAVKTPTPAAQTPVQTTQAQAATAVTETSDTQDIEKNDLRTKFRNNDAKIMGVIIRNFAAKDLTGNQLLREGDVRGNFNNAAERLDELKDLGINVLHVLPINPPGKTNAMGTAGSLYAPADLLAIDPALDDKNDPRTVKEEFAGFIKECHKRGIRVMLDLPSCASFDLFNARKDLMAFEKDGTPKTPGGWNDIRMFNPWKDETKRELNPELIKMHKDYVDMCIDLGVDGIRCDVARTKPTEFWDILIKYSREKDPEFAWLAESYTYEDASPQINMNYDRPKDCLNAGFDSYYGQYHIFHEWTKASELIDYVKQNLEMSRDLAPGKSVIGSFGTHDDESIMNHGGVTYTNLVSGMQATLPMLNPYYFDGYQSGDYYNYDFEGQTDTETDTDSNKCVVHHSKPDIFNFSRPLKGEHPEIGDFMKNTLDVREKYKNILTKGSFIPLQTDNKDDQIIAFARHYKGRTLLVVANRDVSSRQSGTITVPGLTEAQKTDNLFASYGENSEIQFDENALKVDLGPGRVHLFEISVPNIENSGLKVYKQKL